MAFNFKPSDLTSEKSLWDVFKLARKIKTSKFTLIAVILVASMLALNAFILEDDIKVVLNDLRLWSGTGFSFSISTLGFLIAGFTIFATLSKPEMMLNMMDHNHKETGLPILKYTFFTFMRVFIAYIIFAAVFLFVLLFAQDGGFLDNAIAKLPYDYEIKEFLIKIGYVLVGTGFVYLLLLLKTFIFNIYSIVMNMLRWDLHVNHSNGEKQMKNDELLTHIKNEVAQAALEKNKDAVNMYLVIKYADQLKGIDPIQFSEAIGRNHSYATEFRKAIKVAQVIKERGL